MDLFDPDLHISPIALFQRLRRSRDEPGGAPPLLIDLRRRPVGPRLAGTRPDPGRAWQPPADRDVVLTDEDGSRALARARELAAGGHRRVRALYGGMALYDFALDPEVVGAQRFLEEG